MRGREKITYQPKKQSENLFGFLFNENKSKKGKKIEIKENLFGFSNSLKKEKKERTRKRDKVLQYIHNDFNTSLITCMLT